MTEDRVHLAIQTPEGTLPYPGGEAAARRHYGDELDEAMQWLREHRYIINPHATPDAPLVLLLDHPTRCSLPNRKLN